MSRARRSRAPTGPPAARCSPPGVTAIAGFGVLVLSDITMLRDFGLRDADRPDRLAARRAVVLPAVLVLAERDDLLEAALARVRRAVSGLPRPGRRARVA